MTTISQHMTDVTAPRAGAHEEPAGVLPYARYWMWWGVLLGLTVLMLLTETVPLYRAAAVALLIVAMLVKAGVITTWFMHLKFERPGLVIAVVGATVLTAAALFGLIAPDGMAMLEHAAQ
jgi:caa(3)-type oxidase subunit IV